MTTTGAAAAGDRFEEALRFAGEVGAAYDPKADAALVEEASQNFDAARGAHAARQLELRRAVQSLAELLRTGEEAARRPRPEQEYRTEAGALAERRDALSAQAVAGRAEAAKLADAWKQLDAEAQALQSEADRVAELDSLGVPALAAKIRLYATLTNLVWSRSTLDAAIATAPALPPRLQGFVVYPEAGDAQTFETDTTATANPAERAAAFWRLVASPPAPM